MTLTEYYTYNNERALHDAEIDSWMQHLIADITQGTMCYMNGDLQVYSDEGWASFRRIMSEAPWRNAKLN